MAGPERRAADAPGIGRPILIAHRGGARGNEENTAPVFARTEQMPVDMVEFDVRRTVDGALILVHDATVHVGGRRFHVAETPVADLRAAVPGLLTLDEFLEQFGKARPFNLDMKARGYEAEIAAALRRHDVVAQALVSSVHIWSLRRLGRMVPDLALGLSRGHLASSAPPPLQPLAARWLRLTLLLMLLPGLWISRARSVMLQHRVVTPWLVRFLRRRGYRVFTWTVDDPGEAARVARAGVDGIASNTPLDIRDAIASR